MAVGDFFDSYTIQIELGGIKRMVGAYINIIQESPRMILHYAIALYKSLLATLFYHFIATPGQPMRNELIMIIGSDSSLGKSFAHQAVKLNGTVICVDSSKEKGDAFVKSINDSEKEVRAHFFESNLNKLDNLPQIVEEISRNIGDISVFVNCSDKSVVATYYDAFRLLLPVFKSNGTGKGRFVFLRARGMENLNVVASMYDSISKELIALKNNEIFATLANVYSHIGSTADKLSFFGTVSPDEVASTILKGVAKKHKNIYTPGFMVYFAFWLNFFPSIFHNMWDTFLFSSKEASK